jgi:uncharacterized peroxidase-related enzyme
MPRLNVVDPKSAQGEVKQIFEGPLEGKHLNIFKGLANSSAALNAYLGLSSALSKGELTATEREAIALALGEANDCDYCTAAHTAIGKNAGMSEDETIAARKGDPADPKTKALVTFVLKLRDASGWVEDQDVQAVKDAGYSDGAVAEAVANYALNVFTNYFNHVNQTEVDFPKAPAMV